MRSIKIALALVFVAASAHAEPAVYPGLIPDYQKLEPSGAYVFNATDGQWHANSSTNPLYCSVPSGGSGGAVTQGSPPWTFDLTKLNGATVSASNPLPVRSARCPSGAHLKSVRAAPSGSNVSLTLTGMCASGTCDGCTVENIDATAACAVAFNASDASAGRILYSAAHPTLDNSFDSWNFESSVTSIRVATSGISDPESRTIGACDLQVTCCGQ